MKSGTSTARSCAPAGLRALQFSDRYAALGLAVSYLMTKPAFARLPFGHWSRVLTGAINRGEYVIVCDAGSVLGFAGWAFASPADAEAWLDGRAAAVARPDAGDCLVVNAWAAGTPRAHQFLLREVRRRTAGAIAIYARREYADGRSRAVRLFVSGNERPPPTNGAPKRGRGA